MTCRIADLLKIPPSQIDHLPAADVQLLARYWEEEPWGAWRDNLHAAMICREIRRAYYADRRIGPLDPFMIRKQEERRAQNLGGLVAALRAMAGAPKRKPATG